MTFDIGTYGEIVRLTVIHEDLVDEAERPESPLLAGRLCCPTTSPRSPDSTSEPTYPVLTARRRVNSQYDTATLDRTMGTRDSMYPLEIGVTDMSVVGLDHVQVAAPPGCEVGARRFYGTLLGLEEIEKPDALRLKGGVWFSCGKQQLHIGVEDQFTPAQKAHPALRVVDDGLDGLAMRLQQAGESVVWDETMPGVRRFYTHDPWGNRVELLADARGLP